MGSEVTFFQQVPKRFDTCNQRSSSSVVSIEGVVEAIPSPSDGERRDEVLGPADDIMWICHSETA